jgi:hypothetical protein
VHPNRSRVSGGVAALAFLSKLAVAVGDSRLAPWLALILVAAVLALAVWLLCRRLGVEPDADRPVPASARVGPPVALSWRTPTVLRLARQAALASDAAMLPVLADALEEAGCGEGGILQPLRGGDQAAAWWAVARLLRGEAAGEEHPRTA